VVISAEIVVLKIVSRKLLRFAPHPTATAAEATPNSRIRFHSR
jgi:hypothetical protein